MVSLRQAQAFHHDVDEHGRRLTASERERLARPYLPKRPSRTESPSPQTRKARRFHHKKRVRPAIKHLLHALIFHIVHTLFSVYVQIRQTYHAISDRILAVLYHHHRTPELIRRDVKSLNRLPKHLSVILDIPPEGGKRDGLETALNDACEIVAWCACVGVPTLSIYEQTGILKASMPHLRRRVARTLTAYYGANSASRPSVALQAPSQPRDSPALRDAPAQHLDVILLDASDGRQTLVDLTKTLAEMSQRGKLAPADISTELIDAEISDSVMGEPDLLVVFGPRVMLDGYPPWQVRLTEIFHVQDHTGGVGYQIFLKALYKYAKAEFRLGR